MVSRAIPAVVIHRSALFLRAGRLPALFSLLILAAACSSAEPGDRAAAVALTEVRPGAMRAHGWLQFRFMKLHTDAESEQPVVSIASGDSFVRGEIVGGLFFADAPIEGIFTEAELPPKSKVAPGFLHLETRSFTDEAARANRRYPSVPGWRDIETGAFYPSGQPIQGSGDPATH